MTTATDTPRIYVACLASCNAGKRYGEWIDATDGDTIYEEIHAMLSESPEPNAEEWAIHDYEGFSEIKLDEHENIDKVAGLGALIEEHGEAYAPYASYVGLKSATADSFQEAYCGEHSSELSYAEELFDECYRHEVTENIQNYIDYEAFARDLFCGDHYSLHDSAGALHIFRSL